MNNNYLTTDKSQKYNKLVNHPIQSWEWGQFRQKTGNKILRLGIFRNKKLVAALQLTIHKIPLLPFKLGVLLKGPQPSATLLKALKTLAKKENLLFIRMEPNTQLENGKWKMETILRKFGAKPGRPFFTKQTFIIDLTKSEGDLLKAMRPKTRYNIRLSERHGVKIKEDNSQKTFNRYLDLTNQTTKRQNFFAHTEKYHKLMWQTLNPNNPRAQLPNSLKARLLTATYKGKILATWILFVWKDTLYYPYGASSDEHKEVMASYALMWNAIKFGKKLGLKKFDLWGVEKGKGFTRFKEGFGPQKVEFIGTWDLVINPFFYALYRFAEDLRWFILKLPLPFPKPKFR